MGTVHTPMAEDQEQFRAEIGHMTLFLTDHMVNGASRRLNGPVRLVFRDSICGVSASPYVSSSGF